jgi:hypothetical protein
MRKRNVKTVGVKQAMVNIFSAPVNAFAVPE